MLHDDGFLSYNPQTFTYVVRDGSAEHEVPEWAVKIIGKIAVAGERAKVEELEHDFDVQQFLIEKLQSENAKLRTFITGYVLCNETHGSCIGAECPLHRQTDDYSKFDNWCSKYTLARELGIEVTA